MSKKLLAALLAVCMVAGLLFVPAAAASTFTDVGEDHWASGAIERWAGYDVLTGHGDGTFTPDVAMTRAEFASMLVNMLGLTAKSDKAFDDVDADAWYAEVISIAVKAGIITGRGNNKFEPNEPVSFEEAVVMMCRAFGLAKTTEGTDWSKESVEKLTSLGMIGEGADEHLQVGVDCSRAVVAALASAVVTEYVDEDRAEPITGEIPGVVLVVKGAKAEIKDATLAAPVVAESAQVTLTNTKADAVIVSGKDAAVTADEASSVASVTLAGEAPKADIKGEVASVTIAEETTGAVVEAPKADADAIVNNSTESATVNGDTVEGKTEEPTDPTDPDDGKYNGSVSGGGDVPASKPGDNVKPPVTEAHTHNYVAAKNDKATHKLTCTTGKVGDVDVTGCGDAKYEAHNWGANDKCTVCGEDKPATTTGTPSAPTCSGEGNVDGAHNFGTTPTSTTPATCVAGGSATYTCQNGECGATRTDTIPALGHAYGNPVVEEATCGDTGTRTYTCPNCADNVTGHTKTETIPATGAHTWDKGTVKTQPTCIGKGAKTFTCTVCDHTEDVEIPATGNHVFDATKGSEYGKNDDQHWLICATEGCSEASTTKTNHVYNQEDGTKCVCGATKPADPEEPGHVHQAAADIKAWSDPETGTGHKVKKCSCGEVVETCSDTETVAASEAGYTVCKTCGGNKTACTSHSYGSWTAGNPATTGEDASKVWNWVRTCTKCNHEDTTTTNDENAPTRR